MHRNRSAQSVSTSTFRSSTVWARGWSLACRIGGTLAVLYILSAGGLGTAFAASPSIVNQSASGINPEPNPAWCHEGYRCLTMTNYAQMTIIKINLENDLRKAQARSGHVGFGCSIGPGVGEIVDKDFGGHLVALPGALVCGLTVRFGGL